MKTTKNQAAAALVAERWKKTTPEERSDYARKLNAARWGAVKAKAKAAAKKQAAAKKKHAAAAA